MARTFQMWCCLSTEGNYMWNKPILLFLFKQNKQYYIYILNWSWCHGALTLDIVFRVCNILSLNIYLFNVIKQGNNHVRASFVNQVQPLIFYKSSERWINNITIMVDAFTMHLTPTLCTCQCSTWSWVVTYFKAPLVTRNELWTLFWQTEFGF